MLVAFDRSRVVLVGPNEHYPIELEDLQIHFTQEIESAIRNICRSALKSPLDFKVESTWRVGEYRWLGGSQLEFRLDVIIRVLEWRGEMLAAIAVGKTTF